MRLLPFAQTEMRRRPAFYALLIGTAGLLIAATSAEAVNALNAQEQRGKDVYSHGTGSEPLFAEIHGTGMRVAGSVFPCIQCHGEDGAGGREGGVTAANISFEYLTTTLNDPETGRTARAPYNKARLAAAIRLGLNPENKPLHQAMPRYIIGDRDLEALLTYMQRLGNEPVAGISSESIRIGILLPSTGPLQPAAAAVQTLLSAYFADLNARGGIYSRQLTLAPIFFDPAVPGAALKALKARHETDPLFCLLGNIGVSVQDEVNAYIADRHLPIIAPLSLTPSSANALDSAEIFYVRPSIFDQARILVDYLANDLAQPEAETVLLFADDFYAQDAAIGTRKQMQRYRMRLVTEHSYKKHPFDAAAITATLRHTGAGSVFFYGSGADAIAFLNEAHRQNWHPLLLGAADLFGPALTSLPEFMVKQVYLVAPFTMPDFKSKGVADFFRFADTHHIPLQNPAFLFPVYAGASLMEEILKRVGLDITQKKFIDNLLAVHDFKTDLLPSLSYDANSRIGTQSAAIVAPDPQRHGFAFLSGWREPRK